MTMDICLRLSTLFAVASAVHLRSEQTLRESSTSGFTANKACPDPVSVKYGTACRCTSSECADLTLPAPTEGEALVVTSTQGTVFFDGHIVKTTNLPPAKEWNYGYMVFSATNESPLSFNHKIHGFGTAFTDAMAFQYSKLNSKMQDTLIEKYYGSTGSGYSTGRVPMGASDFSRADYTLIDSEGNFCLRDDSSANPPCGTDYKTDPILAAQQKIASIGGTLDLFLSPWSAEPAIKDQKWTCNVSNSLAECGPVGASVDQVSCTEAVEDPCSNNAITERCPQQPGGTIFKDPIYVGPGAKLQGDEQLVHNADNNCWFTGMLADNEEAMATWADRFVKFIGAYAEKGIKMWGLTVQNEPLTQTGLWNSMFYTPMQEATFLKDYLGPAIRNSEYNDVKIMISDDQTTTLISFAKAVFDILVQDDATQYVDGVAFHWYSTFEGLYENSAVQSPTGVLPLGFPDVGGGLDVRTLSEALAKDGKFVYMTEACNGFALGMTKAFGFINMNDLGPAVGSAPGAWGYGYSYSHDVMWQLKNGAIGWTDWNAALAMDGGPNHAGNQVDSPVLVQDSTSFLHNPSYYHLAHYARYIPRGSRQVMLDTMTCTLSKAEYCTNYVAFVTPSKAPEGASWVPNSLVVVITNDEITAVPQHLGGIGEMTFPTLAMGQGSLTVSTKKVDFSIGCGNNFVTAELPWQSISTVVMPCGDGGCDCKPAKTEGDCSSDGISKLCEGAVCWWPAACASGNCTNWKCSKGAGCNPGGDLSNWVAGSNLCVGHTCVFGSSCNSGKCYNGKCAEKDACNPGHGNNLCKGAQCMYNSSCASGSCSSAFFGKCN